MQTHTGGRVLSFAQTLRNRHRDRLCAPLLDALSPSGDVTHRDALSYRSSLCVCSSSRHETMVSITSSIHPPAVDKDTARAKAGTFSSLRLWTILHPTAAKIHIACLRGYSYPSHACYAMLCRSKGTVCSATFIHSFIHSFTGVVRAPEETRTPNGRGERKRHVRHRSLSLKRGLAALRTYSNGLCASWRRSPLSTCLTPSARRSRPATRHALTLPLTRGVAPGIPLSLLSPSSSHPCHVSRLPVPRRCPLLPPPPLELRRVAAAQEPVLQPAPPPGMAIFRALAPPRPSPSPPRPRSSPPSGARCGPSPLVVARRAVAGARGPGRGPVCTHTNEQQRERENGRVSREPRCGLESSQGAQVVCAVMRVPMYPGAPLAISTRIHARSSSRC